MQKHYVTFFSPGTFFSEQTEKEVVSWDIEEATKLARSVSERYGARPYGFQFTTKERSESDWEPKTVDRSPMYYLGGIIRTREEVLSGTDPKESILRSNVEYNNINRVLENNNSFKATLPLKDDDIVLDFKF